MMINGFVAHFWMFLFMFPITHQSVVPVDYEPNSKKDEITIDINVNININGSKTTDIPPGNLLFSI